MSAVGPVDLRVDLAQLQDLGRELDDLIVALEGMQCRPVTTGYIMGSEIVSDATHLFGDRWQSGRVDIAEKLRACRAFVQLATETYGKNEAGLCSVLESEARR